MEAITVTTTARSLQRLQCKHCGHTAEAEVTGFGEGTQSSLNAEGTALERAQADAQKDIERAIADVRCPKCQMRPEGAEARFWGPWVGMFAGGWVLGGILGAIPTVFDINMSQEDRVIAFWATFLILGVSTTLVVPLTAHSRYVMRDRRVRWL